MPLPVSLSTFAGVSPPWSLAQLDANFAALAAPIASVNNYATYLVDTGAADAYVVTLAAGTTCTLAAGLSVDFLATNDNTGASTLNVNGTGIVAITNWDASSLVAGQIKNGQVVRAIYDGTQYKIVGQFVGALPGLLDLSAATAGQIKFPATENPSSDTSTLDDYREKQFQATLTGCTTAPTTTVTFVRVGKIVVLTVSTQVTATSNDGAMTLTGGTSDMFPGSQKLAGFFRVFDNGAWANGMLQIETNGVLTFLKDVAGNPFTASGTKGVGVFTVTYELS